MKGDSLSYDIVVVATVATFFPFIMVISSISDDHYH